LLDNLIDKKNQDISRKSTDLIFSLKDKLIGDLFNPKNRSLEDIFFKPIKHLGQENFNPIKLIKKHSFRKSSINSNSNLKNHKFIIDEMANFLKNKDHSMNQQISPERIKLSVNPDKILTNTNSSSNFNINNINESTIDEKTEIKDYTSGLTTSSAGDIKSSRFFEKELQNLQIEKMKEDQKIIHIVREIKDKYLNKKEISIVGEKVYAQRLEEDQIYLLFGKYFDERIANSHEFYLFLLKGNFNESRFIGKKSKRRENLTEKDIEKSFHTRKGICQHLSRVVSRLVFFILTLDS
jgi:hypothetical protein